ncbi:single-stranded DNA-binding protein [bacterium]|nr:single-stranded DNA-binding protein [bacterium]
MTIQRITDTLIQDLQSLSFKDPVCFVYNPLEYARKPYDLYFEKYGRSPKEVLLIGMNPGPFGMAQTGVPFGEVDFVKNWLAIEAEVGTPVRTHPKRPIEGFSCRKSEVSGKRVWGWAKDRLKTTDRFFSQFLVINYCPLIFLEESGRNRTPDKLPKTERESLFAACDKALMETINLYSPKHVIGIGAFAEKRVLSVVNNSSINVGRILHPSPANPKANKGWADIIETELAEIGISIAID